MRSDPTRDNRSVNAELLFTSASRIDTIWRPSPSQTRKSPFPARHGIVHHLLREQAMTTMSILELVRVTEETDARGALYNARDLAAHAEKWGYHRIWVAEHHNMAGIASAATSVVLGHLAAGTNTIRIGAGGIMLPNHAPYVIAEQFGTLAQLFPGRIDLGLGRAPGTDQLTLRALRRLPESAENFPQDILELQAFLARQGRTSAFRPCPPPAPRCRCGFWDRATSAQGLPPSSGCPTLSPHISRQSCLSPPCGFIAIASSHLNSLIGPMR